MKKIGVPIAFGERNATQGITPLRYVTPWHLLAQSLRDRSSRGSHPV